ncbi:hypothetical protein D3C84_1094570 [compost metagenome]
MLFPPSLHNESKPAAKLLEKGTAPDVPFLLHTHRLPGHCLSAHRAGTPELHSSSYSPVEKTAPSHDKTAFLIAADLPDEETT